MACPSCTATRSPERVSSPTQAAIRLPSILALAPVMAAGLIESDIIVDAKSGVSGAGRSVDVKFLFTEGGTKACALMESVPIATCRRSRRSLGRLNGNGASPLSVTFLPHLIPMTRGILASCYAKFRAGESFSGETGQTRLMDLYRDFFADHPFVHVADEPPSTKQTLGNNDCRIYPTVDRSTGRLVRCRPASTTSSRGAAGQAVQNMNIMFGMPRAAWTGGACAVPLEGVEISRRKPFVVSLSNHEQRLDS